MYRYSYNKSVQLFFVSPLTLTLEFRIRIRIPNYKKLVFDQLTLHLVVCQSGPCGYL